MAPRNLPGVGLQGYAPKSEVDWHLWMNSNLSLLSALVQGRVNSVLGAVPTSGISNGDMHILTAGPNAHKIACRDNGAWVYIVAQIGWRLFDLADEFYWIFNGSSWQPDTPVLFPPASITPATNGEMSFQLTSNTSLTIKVRGSDGVVRSAVIPLS